MSRVCVIVGKNGYKYMNAPASGFYEAIDEYRSELESISCVAVGPKEYYAVICKNGKATYCGPAEFESAIHKTRRSQIKHISFGCDDQWVITMKDGSYFAEIDKDSTCFDVLEKHQGNISYVSLCDQQNVWVVGYGTNDYETGSMVCEKLKSLLRGMKASDNTIGLVELSNRTHFFVRHGGGSLWTLPTELSTFLKESKTSVSSISLFDERDSTEPLSRNEILEDKLADLETKYNAMSKEKETLQKELNKLKGNDVKTISLNDLYERKHSVRKASGAIDDEIESRHKNTALCITCLNNEPKVLFQPCNHIVMCKDCTKKLTRKECPVCLTKVKNSLDIFRASFQFH